MLPQEILCLFCWGKFPKGLGSFFYGSSQVLEEICIVQSIRRLYTCNLRINKTEKYRSGPTSAGSSNVQDTYWLRYGYPVISKPTDRQSVRSWCFRIFEGQRMLRAQLWIFPAPLWFEERKYHPVSGEPGFARHKAHPVGREASLRFIRGRTGVPVRPILL